MYDPSNSSVSTHSAEDHYSISHSSAPTSPDESSMNKSQSSPDLLQTEFYNSDNLKDHARNLRMSMIHSDSMDSFKFQHYSEKTTGIAMTNSPSFSALASILEKKSSYKPSPLQNGHNQSSDTIIPIKEEEFDQDEQISQNTPTLINLNKNDEQNSPNLIQFDDIDDSDYHQNQPQKEQVTTPLHQQTPDDDDIFKTPEIKQSGQFSKKPFESMLDVVDEHTGVVPEIIDTPKPSEIGNFDLASPQKVIASPIVNAPNAPNAPNTDLKPPPLPKPSNYSAFQTGQTLSPQYAKRSTSLPVLAEPKKEKKKGFFSIFKTNKRSVSSSVVEPIKQQPLPQLSSPELQQQKPKLAQSKSFNLDSARPTIAKRSTSSTSLFSAFKRKSKVIDLEEPQQLEPQQEQAQTEAFETDSASSTPQRSLPSPVQRAQSPTILTNNIPIDSYNDTHSFSDNDFQEDFNHLTINKRPTSQISQNGETLFPKSLNAQEVESIVSIERNRSLRSVKRNSNSQIHQQLNSQYLQPQPQSYSQNRLSLTDAISLNAREEGMSVEIGKQSSIPDSSRSPTQSVLKKTSITSLRRYLDEDQLIDRDEEDEEDEEELFNVEEFASHALEFDDIADNFEANEDVDDLSNLMEFADFIDFGDGMELNFDYESNKSSPLSTPPLNQPTITTSQQIEQPHPLKVQQSVPSPVISIPESFTVSASASASAAASPSLASVQNSPLSSPFLQQTAYMPSNNMSRPISMSFRGLKAPVFENPSFRYNGSETDGSSVRSQQSSSNISSRRGGYAKTVTFSSRITLYDVYNGDDYDRHPDIATCNQLTPVLAQQIRQELNELKTEMTVHEDSRCYTHFF